MRSRMMTSKKMDMKERKVAGSMALWHGMGGTFAGIRFAGCRFGSVCYRGPEPSPSRQVGHV